MELSFGEQIKIILKRKNMTIQDLAELYEARTGMSMTRQNLSQRLRRDNFPEQDMHLLAAILGYQVSLQLIPFGMQVQEAAPMPVSTPVAQTPVMPTFTHVPQTPVMPTPKPVVQKPSHVTTADGSTLQIPNEFCKPQPVGDINPHTGQEYLTNTVRRHPSLPDYVQVYDQSTHEWSDVNEDYFWQFQANKKQLLGSEYQEPILI